MSMFTTFIAKLKKNIIGYVDNGRTVEMVRLKRKGFILVEDKKKQPRAWLLLSPNHIKFDKKTKLEVVWLSSERAVTLNSELSAVIKKAWKDGIKHQKDLLAEFVEKWEQDSEGNIYPKKIKDEIEFSGVSISQEHVSEVIKYFDPNLLYSHIENETTARILSRTYGFDMKTFMSAFIGVLLAVMIAYYLIQSNSIDAGAIANAVKTTIQANATHVTNATLISG